MNKLVYLFLVLAIFLQSNLVVAESHKKIVYTLEIENNCKNIIKSLDIIYDGQDFFINKGGHDIGYRSGSSYDMPMTIPDLAQITWKDSKGTPYEAKVPLRSLIRFKDYFLHEFRVEFHFCDSQLRVVFGKAKGRFEYTEKEIWSNQKGKAAIDKHMKK